MCNNVKYHLLDGFSVHKPTTIDSLSILFQYVNNVNSKKNERDGCAWREERVTHECKTNAFVRDANALWMEGKYRAVHTFDLQSFIDIVATLLFDGSYDICEEK